MPIHAGLLGQRKVKERRDTVVLGKHHLLSSAVGHAQRHSEQLPSISIAISISLSLQRSDSLLGGAHSLHCLVRLLLLGLRLLCLFLFLIVIITAILLLLLLLLLLFLFLAQQSLEF